MRTGRKTFLSLVACCLLLSQQAALLHAISHLEFPNHARNTRSEIVAIALDQVASSEFCPDEEPSRKLQPWHRIRRSQIQLFRRLLLRSLLRRSTRKTLQSFLPS